MASLLKSSAPTTYYAAFNFRPTHSASFSPIAHRSFVPESSPRQPASCSCSRARSSTAEKRSCGCCRISPSRYLSAMKACRDHSFEAGLLFLTRTLVLNLTSEFKSAFNWLTGRYLQIQDTLAKHE